MSYKGGAGKDFFSSQTCHFRLLKFFIQQLKEVDLSDLAFRKRASGTKDNSFNCCFQV
jgi:hypothetical protein